MKRSILIIDDDKDLAEVTSDMLKEYQYEVTVAGSGEESYGLLKRKKYHLIVLDINLPRETGFEICKELREISTIPIIFASARTSEDDRITGFDIGGDDYLSKPYSLKELLSRINALIRRTYGFEKEEKIYRTGTIEIYENARIVKKNGKPVSLSLKEFDLLLYLAQNADKALKKEEILRSVWGAYSEVELSTVAVHIRWLREKLEENPAEPEYIRTVWGIGYSLRIKGI